jgi:hypothetical protein
MADDTYRSTDFSLTIPERIQAYFRSCKDAEQYEGFETHPSQQATLVPHSEALQQVVYRLIVPNSLCNKCCEYAALRLPTAAWKSLLLPTEAYVCLTWQLCI